MVDSSLKWVAKTGGKNVLFFLPQKIAKKRKKNFFELLLFELLVYARYVFILRESLYCTRRISLAKDEFLDFKPIRTEIDQ